MNELRFSCSKCGQHLKAEAGCGGMVIQCPLCRAHVRIPPSPGRAEDGSLPTAWETASLPTAAAGSVRPTGRGNLGDRASDAPGDPALAGEDGPAGQAALRGGGPGAGALLAVVLVATVAGVGLWLWQPWRTGTTSPPAAQTGGAATDPAGDANPGSDLSEIPVTQGKPDPPATAATGTEQVLMPGGRVAATQRGADSGGAAGVREGEAAALADSWTVDFARLPEDARAVVEAQLEPLGLAVSPSVYTATTGRKVTLPARRGTRLEVIEEVARQLGWTPVYDGRQLKFERGARNEPTAFAGPFLLRVAQVAPSSSYATAEVTLRLTGVGIPDSLRQAWLNGFDGLKHVTATAADGTDLVDPYGGHWSKPTGANTRLLEADQVVGLWQAFRGVTRVVSLRAELELPGLPAPHDRLEFEFTDLPLKPGPNTPETERPLAFSGDVPVVARLHSIIPGVQFDRARVEIQNLADRPLRSVVLELTYRDAAGDPAGRIEFTCSDDNELPGVRDKKRLDHVLLRNRPEMAARVDVEVAAAVFTGGVEWKRAE